MNARNDPLRMFSTFMQQFMGRTCQDNNARIYYTEFYANAIQMLENNSTKDDLNKVLKYRFMRLIMILLI